MTNHTSRAWIPKRNATPTRSAGADDRSGAPSAGRGKQCPPPGVAAGGPARTGRSALALGQPGGYRDERRFGVRIARVQDRRWRSVMIVGHGGRAISADLALIGPIIAAGRGPRRGGRSARFDVERHCRPMGFPSSREARDALSPGQSVVDGVSLCGAFTSARRRVVLLAVPPPVPGAGLVYLLLN
jgi:hypothetical protein